MSIPLIDLLDLVRVRSGIDTLTQEWLDSALPEMMAYLVAGPAGCKRGEWLVWDDVSADIQAILVGTLSRHATMGQGSIAEERIGDYAIKYSDPALFEGRIPRYFNDGEEHAIGRLAGCYGSLYSVQVEGALIHDLGVPEQPDLTPLRKRVSGP